jgi:DNA-binding transcriptional LysR family regulator
MTLSQDQLNAFFEVVRLGSFTKAAEAIGLTQSALSHRLKNLEQNLEATLIIRDPQGLRLTDAGNKLFQYCRVQTQIEDELIEDLKISKGDSLSGYLRIAGASTLMGSAVTPVLAPFLTAHPAVQLNLMSRELSELPSLLQKGEVDFIVTCGSRHQRQFVEEFLGEERSVLVKAKKESTRCEVYLDHDADDSTTLDYFKSQINPPKKIKRSYVDDIHGIIAGVEAGIGRALIPMHLLKNAKGLERVSGYKEFRQSVFLYYVRQPFYSKLHQATVKTLKEGIGKALKV